jgi:CO/xanthine dehydrogenase FAD-binding subunit
MIPFDFDYVLPETLQEAYGAWRGEKEAGRSAVYYGGGTEIVTLARSGTITPQCVIDLKGVPECSFSGEDEGRLVFGAACFLTDIVEENLFPLLSEVCRGVADRTVRNRLTLGGNVCGRLPYREALLPFLCVGAAARVFGVEGLREEPLETFFDKRLKLDDGEFLAALVVEKESARLLSAHCRKVRGGRVDYPVCTVAGAADGDSVRLAVSGAWDFPVVADCTSFTPPEKIVADVPHAIKDDAVAASDYRGALLLQAVEKVLLSLEVMPE